MKLSGPNQACASPARQSESGAVRDCSAEAIRPLKNSEHPPDNLTMATPLPLPLPWHVRLEQEIVARHGELIDKAMKVLREAQQPPKAG